jgi:hypothetical protein
MWSCTQLLLLRRNVSLPYSQSRISKPISRQKSADLYTFISPTGFESEMSVLQQSKTVAATVSTVKMEPTYSPETLVTSTRLQGITTQQSTVDNFTILRTSFLKRIILTLSRANTLINSQTLYFRIHTEQYGDTFIIPVRTPTPYYFF